MDAIGFENKILIIDDEWELLDLLEAYLAKEGFKTVLKAATGHEGIELCRSEKPDIIVLDVMLPDMDGFEVCREIRQFTYEPVLFLSARGEEVDKLLGLGIGGDDYITKPFSLREITFRIKAQLRRKQYAGTSIAGNVFRFGDIRIDESKCEVKKGESVVDLTAKEFQILLFLAEHSNHILSKKKLYENIWGEEYIDDNTIMVHIRHLREKLEDDPGNPAYIVTVKGLGYKLAAKG